MAFLRNPIWGGLILAVVLGFAEGAYADPTVVSYDIQNATVSGTGGWSNTYTGTITPTSGYFANYTGGSGTLNDGQLGDSASDTELFDTSGNPVITVNLDGAYVLSGIDLLSNFVNNMIPGDITSVDVTLGGTTVTYSPSNFGPIGGDDPNGGVGIDELISLTGAQASTATNSFELSNFQITDFIASNVGTYMGFGEITASGAASQTPPAGVPAPGALVLLTIGLAGIGSLRRKAKAV